MVQKILKFVAEVQNAIVSEFQIDSSKSEVDCDELESEYEDIQNENEGSESFDAEILD